MQLENQLFPAEETQPSLSLEYQPHINKNSSQLCDTLTFFRLLGGDSTTISSSQLS